MYFVISCHSKEEERLHLEQPHYPLVKIAHSAEAKDTGQSAGSLRETKCSLLI